MALIDLLTADHWLNPVGSRLYFSRRRFQAWDRQLAALTDHDDAALLQGLAAVHNLHSLQGRGPVLYAVADQTYFDRFAASFVSTAAMASPESPVHIHVIGAKPGQFENFKAPVMPRKGQLLITTEAKDFSTMAPPLRARYCQCLRFIRMGEFIGKLDRDVIAFDIDGLFQKNFANFAWPKPVGLILRQSADPGVRVNAGVVAVRNHRSALKFLHTASTRMMRHLTYSPFIEKLDQRCLSLASDAQNNGVFAIPPPVYSYTPGAGMFYSAKGAGKRGTIQQAFAAILHQHQRAL